MFDKYQKKCKSMSNIDLKIRSEARLITIRLYFITKIMNNKPNVPQNYLNIRII